MCLFHNGDFPYRKDLLLQYINHLVFLENLLFGEIIV